MLADEPEHESPAPESSGHEMNIERRSDVSQDGSELEKIRSAAWPELAEEDIEDDADLMFQCQLCDYIAEGKQEASEHSRVIHSASCCL